MSDWKAYTVIGTNVVIDCGTVEEAIAYERELWANQPYAPATPAPHLADCGYDEPHEPHTYVLAENDRPVDHECPGLAATPAPLDWPLLLVAVRAFQRRESDASLFGHGFDAAYVLGQELEAAGVTLIAIPAGPELRAVTLADTPGPGGKVRRLIVMDLSEFAAFHGRVEP